MPIWDEEWVARAQAVLKRHEDSTTELVLSAECDKERSHGPQRTEGYQDSDARAKLAAAAPAMVRLLLELEWAGAYTTDTGGGDGEPMQPTCLTCEKERSHGHAPDCTWLAVMRAAGVRE